MNVKKFTTPSVSSVAERLQVSDEALTWQNYQPRYQALLDRSLSDDSQNSAEVETWLADYNKLTCELSEVSAKLFIAADLDTKDQQAQQQIKRYLEEVIPQSERASHAINQKWLALSNYTPSPQLAQLYRRTQAKAALFCEENIELGIRQNELLQDYSAITGNQTIHLEGQELNMAQVQQKLSSNNRDERQAAWQAWQDSQLQLSPQLDELFLKLLKIRRQMASNAKQENYRAYRWQDLDRVDYTPADCLTFHESVRNEVVPVLNDLLVEIKKKFDIESIRPWDFNPNALPEMQGKALKPFSNEQELQDLALTTFEKLDAEFAACFKQMQEQHLLDLFARDGKMPHAYCSHLPVNNQSFVLMNATGTTKDVKILFHEIGHAFHGFWSGKSQKLLANRWSPIEFIEIPSMAMEFLVLNHLEHIFSEEDRASYVRKQLEGVITFLPWAAQMDAFQHWLYAEAPDNVSIDDIDAKWLELDKIYHPFVDWQKVDKGLRAKRWHYYHIFQAPFYYIEYAMCYLAAVGIWRQSRDNQAEALQKYKNSLKLGNTVSLPQLYEASGVEFRFDRQYIQDLINFLLGELNKYKNTESRS